MPGRSCFNEEKMEGATEERPIFGKYDEKEMLSGLKALAVNPCDSEATLESIQPLCGQTCLVIKLMALCNPKFPPKKRKLEEFVRDNFKSRAGILRYEASKRRYVKKFDNGQLSPSSSFVVDMANPMDTVNGRNYLNSYSSNLKLTSKDMVKEVAPPSPSNVKYSCPSSKYVDFNYGRSTIESESIMPKHITSHKSPLTDVDDLLGSSYYLCLERTNHEQHHITRRRSNRLLNLSYARFPRSYTRVGPNFQAKIPEWNGENNNVDDDKRWLGTCVWPNDETCPPNTSRGVGEGRPSSCSCVSPGCSDCINHHIKEARLAMQSELGSVFYTWKLNEMGLDISNSWTLEEEKKFNALARSNKFLKRASKLLPSKSKKDILSYYFNVYIPRCTPQVGDDA